MSGLMDFQEEEEKEDAAEFALLEAKPAEKVPVQAVSKPSLLEDFDEEEEEDEQDVLLSKNEKPSKKKKKKMVVSSAESEDEEENQVADSPVKKHKKKKKSKKSRNDEAEEAGEDEDDEEEEAEKGFYEMEAGLDMGEEEEEGEMGEMDDEEEEEEEMDVISRLSIPAPPQIEGKSYFLQLPNFLRIAGGEFDPVMFDGKKESLNADEEVIRWRVNADGQVESNASIVENADGSIELVVGDKPVAILNFTTSKNEFLFDRTLSVNAEDLGEDQGPPRLCFSKTTKLEGSAILLPSDQVKLNQVIKRQRKLKATINETLQHLDPEREQDERSKKVDLFHRQNMRRRNREEHRAGPSRRKKGGWDASFLEEDQKSLKRRKKASQAESEEEELKSSSPDDESD